MDGSPDAYVLAFDSTHAAMAAISALEAAGVSHAVIPTPREISAGCGMSLRFEPGALDGVRACLDLPAGAPLAALYALVAGRYGRVESL